MTLLLEHLEIADQQPATRAGDGGAVLSQRDPDASSPEGGDDLETVTDGRVEVVAHHLESHLLVVVIPLRARVCRVTIERTGTTGTTGTRG